MKHIMISTTTKTLTNSLQRIRTILRFINKNLFHILSTFGVLVVLNRGIMGSLLGQNNAD